MDMPRIGHPRFMGFAAKLRRPRTDWLPASVEAICSATPCQAEMPETWMNQPEFVGGGMLSSEEGVRRAIEEEARAALLKDGPQRDYELFAYRVFPIWFAEDGLHGCPHPDLTAPGLEHEPELAGYERLGYDLLELIYGAYGCSPLSCNGMAQEVPVNRWCLLDTLDAAIETGFRFGREQPEPGDYVIVEVWRRRASL